MFAGTYKLANLYPIAQGSLIVLFSFLATLSSGQATGQAYIAATIVVPNTISTDSGIIFKATGAKIEKKALSLSKSIVHSVTAADTTYPGMYKAIFNISGEENYAYTVSVAKKIALIGLHGEVAECDLYYYDTKNASVFLKSQSSLIIGAKVLTDCCKKGIYIAQDPISVCINMN